jgi:hypothetical protein
MSKSVLRRIPPRRIDLQGISQWTARASVSCCVWRMPSEGATSLQICSISPKRRTVHGMIDARPDRPPLRDDRSAGRTPGKARSQAEVAE